MSTVRLDDISLSAWLNNWNPYIERRQRAKTLGWRYISNGCCPLKLVGKRCRRFDCWCEFECSSPNFRFQRLNDHGATWRDEFGTRFVLWEPFGVDFDDLTELATAARQDGLAVRLIGSVYYPMRTVGIVFTPIEVRPVWITVPHQIELAR
jgi:hypothetical protein